jgi:Ankyrin repeats (3 copies)/Ankyrin repeats (many copies)
MARSLYDELGIAADATTAEIDAAYRERAAALARAADDESRATNRARLDAAYRILRNANTRAEHDRRMRTAVAAAPAPAAATDNPPAVERGAAAPAPRRRWALARLYRGEAKERWLWLIALGIPLLPLLALLAGASTGTVGILIVTMVLALVWIWAAPVVVALWLMSGVGLWRFAARSGGSAPARFLTRAVAAGVVLLSLAGVVFYVKPFFQDPRQTEAELVRMMWQKAPSCPSIGPYSPDAERLRHAASCGDLATVTRLLREGLSPDAAESKPGAREGQTAMHFAAEQDRTGVIDFLVASRANVNARAAGGTSPLHLASSRGRLAAVKALLRHGADPNAVDERGTPLLRALLQGSADIATVLLDQGADPNVRSPADGYTALMAVSGVMIVYPERENLIRRLIAAGADVNAGDTYGNTALHGVARRGSFDKPIETAKALIAAGADVTLRNKEGRTAVDVFRSRRDYAPDPEYERLLTAAPR